MLARLSTTRLSELRACAPTWGQQCLAPDDVADDDVVDERARLARAGAGSARDRGATSRPLARRGRLHRGLPREAALRSRRRSRRGSRRGAAGRPRRACVARDRRPGRDLVCGALSHAPSVRHGRALREPFPREPGSRHGEREVVPADAAAVVDRRQLDPRHVGVLRQKLPGLQTVPGKSVIGTSASVLGPLSPTRFC